MLAFPAKATISILAEAFGAHSNTLTHLIFFHGTAEELGWPEGASAYPTAGDVILPHCKHLRHLCIQDVDLSVASLSTLTSLHSLLAVVGDLTNFAIDLSILHLPALEKVHLDTGAEWLEAEARAHLFEQVSSNAQWRDFQVFGTDNNAGQAFNEYRKLLPPVV